LLAVKEQTSALSGSQKKESRSQFLWLKSRL
jgi:hypothetical protein